MKSLKMHVAINPVLYVKDPDSSELGRAIIKNSIELISQIGFESFTFKKLGVIINSPESSIYRYFKSKHMLLVYLTSWYWSWTEYRLVFATMNMTSAIDRLVKSIDILTLPPRIDNEFSYVNEVLLSEIIFSESIKAYHTKNVDDENQKGCFSAYKSVVERVSNIVLEIKPDYPYPHMLVSTVIEGAHQQKYFAAHLPELTDKVNDAKAVPNFYKDLVLNILTHE